MTWSAGGDCRGTASSRPMTLADLLQRRAEQQPDDPAFTFLDEDVRSLSYRELDNCARAVATAVSEYRNREERVLICLPPGLDYVSALLGCAYAGVVAVPAYLPDARRPKRTATPLRTIAYDAQPVVAISPLSEQHHLRTLLATSTRVMPIEEALAAPPSEDATPTAADALALLMYTSGSTSSPRGVMVRHRNLFHNVSAFEGFGDTPPTGFVSWLPIYHDLGLLFGVLHPLFYGVRATLFAPNAFVERPLRWLEAIGLYAASASAAPNWAFDLCVRASNADDRAALDLHTWTLALNGGEPVRRKTLERFADAFAPAGFRAEALHPSYGLAEGIGTVSGGQGGRGFIPLTVDRRALEAGEVAKAHDNNGRVLVACGRSLPGQEIRIVDPESRLPCPPNQVGEVWVAGPSVCDGYWGRAEESERTFRARLSTGDGPFLRTGDLGFLRDGELMIAGRMKDVIIIRGTNHFAEDIELAAEGAHALIRAGGCAAFAIERDEDERLAVICELRNASVADARVVIEAVREAIAEHHEIDVYILALVERGTIPKTTSGKVRRAECRRAYLARELPTIAEWRRSVAPLEAVLEPTAPDVAKWRGLAQQVSAYLVAYFARKLGIDPAEVDRTAPFARFGLTSLEGISLAATLGRHLSTQLSPTLLWEHSSIQALANWTTEEDRTPARRREVGSPGQDVPVAVIGLACRFPGAASPDKFWRLLHEGEDAITSAPPDRWRPGGLGAAGRFGGFLHGIDRFDAAFFGISPREAPHVDPRQRLVLELAWEALEDAGIPPDSLAGSDAGVLIAVLSNDYDQLLFRDLDRVDAYSGPGTANSIVANRVSYALDLHGPSLVVDTACSGSLVALHLACQSIRSGESHVALAGGVSINLLPHGDMFFAAAGGLSPDGRCRTFDAAANGIVRSEGAGLVVLKALADATADGDHIYAVIRGSAVNSDGRTSGLMAPNGRAQEAVLRRAYQRAGVDPRDVEYVEVHGTGTAIGDPIELRALGAVLGEGRQPGRLCAVGSLKTNLGHLEPAAGIAGVIKVALALEHGEVPPTLHFEHPNPHIPFDQLPFTVAREPIPWPEHSTPRVAGVSGFGFGGTNAHVVLEEAPKHPVASVSAEGTHVLPLSARSDSALSALVRSVSDLLVDDTTDNVGDVCFTAAALRSHHENRLAAVGSTRKELREALTAFAAGGESPSFVIGTAPREDARSVFVFSGQGTQWPAMGAVLLQQEPVFRKVLVDCDHLFRRLGGPSILARLTAGGAIDETDVAQPAIFAIQVALAALWRSYGVEPDAVVGQSLGEVAAAHVSGALTLEDAVTVVHHRSRLMKLVDGKGKTAVVTMPVSEASLALAGSYDHAAIAGATGPRTTILAGDEETLRRILESLDRRGVPGRFIPGVDIAFHTRQMDPLLPDLVQALAPLAPCRARMPMISTVTGERVEGGDLGPEYWAQNLREPFHLDTAVAQLVRSGHRIFIEIGPHAVLSSALQETGRAAGATVTALASMRQGVDSRETIASTLARLYVAGLRIDWRGVYPHGRRLPFPPYPWQRTRHWFDQLGNGTLATANQPRGNVHPLAGRHVEVADPPSHVWTTTLATTSPSYIADHRVLGAAAVPASVYVEMALAAAVEALPPSFRELADVQLKQLLFLDKRERTVQLVLRPTADGGFTFAVFSRGGSGEPWVELAAGIIREADSAAFGTAEVPPALNRGVEEGGRHYERMRARGLDYGTSFQVIQQVANRDGEVVARLRLPPELVSDAAHYVIHPALLDGALQVIAAAFTDVETGSNVYLPVAIKRVGVSGPMPSRLWCQARVRLADAENVEADVSIMSEDGRVVAYVAGLQLRRLTGGEEPAAEVGPLLHEVAWQPGAPAAPIAGSSAAAGRWLLLAGADKAGPALASLLTKYGGECVLLREDNAADLSRVIASQDGWRGIVYLWGIGQSPPDDAQKTDDQSGVRRALDQIRGIVHGLREAPSANSARLWLATRGAQAVGGTPVSAALGALWGLGRVLANEHPEFWGGLIDLDPAASASGDARMLLDELICLTHEQVAFRGGRRYVARLRQLPVNVSERPYELDADGAYLVTGGFGGLGVEVAHFLVQRGARTLVLLGRSADVVANHGHHPASDRISAAVHALEERGAAVEVAAVDIADEPALAAFIQARHAASRPPIRGVVHAAGVNRDRLLLKSNSEDLDAVLRPKVAGACALLHLFGPELKFFILFSSISSLLGPVGQAAYSAANAYIDALAHVLRSRGLPATSISWGPWADVGMAARTGVTSGGVQPISIAEGLRALDWVLRQDPSHVAVIRADWTAVATAMGKRVPFLEDVVHRPAPSGPDDDVVLLQDLLLTPPGKRQALIEARICDLAARVLRLDPSQLDARQPLNVLGMDSIMAVELRHQVEAVFSLTFTIVDLLEGSSIADLAGRLASQLPADEIVAELLAEIEGLSSDDVRARLTEEGARDLWIFRNG